MSTDDEIRMVLSGRDIEMSRERRFLCVLSEMDGGGKSAFLSEAVQCCAIQWKPHSYIL
jgi:hypothetical protein